MLGCVTVAIPQLSEAERAEALKQAALSRAIRADIRVQIKERRVTIAQVLERATHDSIVGKMRVSALLESLPHVGKTRCRTLMEKLAISPARRIQGLGVVQRRALLQEFED